MNSGAFDEAAFDFLVSDEGGANVAAPNPPKGPQGPGAGPAPAPGEPGRKRPPTPPP
ncbi:isocitrate dehydrogenase (NADP(+)), partial [Burkholderia pseudomallei]|nr:isocitrate dehydrogenase (NADP(+)) [Burkholderia pseudomallei]